MTCRVFSFTPITVGNLSSFNTDLTLWNKGQANKADSLPFECYTWHRTSGQTIQCNPMHMEKTIIISFNFGF